MTNDGLQELIQEQISHWLKDWHSWSACARSALGYPRSAAGCGMYRASRQYDDQNGSLDLEADIAICKAVDRVIGKIANPHNAALHFEAKNLCSSRVWRSARVDQDQAEKIIAEARTMLWMGMVEEGLA